MNNTSNENTTEEKILIPIDRTDTDKCRILWISVILQNLSDALYNSDKYPFKQRREDALEWFKAKDGEDSDFAIICSRAGLDFQRTKARMDKFVNHEIEAIDFRCFRKGHFDKPPTENRSAYLNRMKRKQEFKRKMITPAFFKKKPISTRVTVSESVQHPQAIN